ncbi:MAG: hypothetical protein ACSHWU_13120, partial [Marinicella sp.]
MMIDWPYIERTYDQILQEVSALHAFNDWSVKPQKLAVTKHKTKYGMADIDGVVYINQAFIGTTAVRLLTATIRHELAHLCVGLQCGHNYKFKAKAKQFKAVFGRDLKTESAQVHAAIGYKYKLYATIEQNQDNPSEEILFRRVHRKHHKYVNYKPGRFRYLSIKGRKV